MIFNRNGLRMTFNTTAYLFPRGHFTQQLSPIKFLPDESVDFGNINVIQLLDSVLDLMFVCLDVHDKHKGVVVLNLFHGGLCCQGELDDGIVIQPTKKLHN